MAAGACAAENACGGPILNQSCWCDENCDTYHDCCAEAVRDCRSPKINSITPTSGHTNGVRIQILGSYLKGSSPLSSGAYTSVDLRTSPATPGTPCALVTNSATSVECDVPAGAGKNYQVHVATQVSNYQGTFALDGFSSAPYLFSYNAPVVSSVDLSDDASAAGTGTLTLTGTDFGTTQGSVSLILFGETTSTINCPVIAQDHTRIQCSLPVLTGDGDWNAQITVGQQLSGVMGIPPHLVSVSPASAWVGDAVTLSGINFGRPPPFITVGGVDWGPTCLSHTHTSINCTVPQGVGQNLDLRVAAHGQNSNVRTFSYGPPQINGMTPTGGRTAGGYPVTLAGRGFGTTNAAVTVGGSLLPGTQVTAQADDHLTFTLPEGEGSAQIIVGIAGQTSNAVTFNYAAPAIGGVSRFIDNGQEKIQIEGDNFGLTGSASVNGVGCPVSQRSHTQIVCALPPGGGAVPVVVAVAGAMSPPFTFNYPPPTISGISPPTGNTAGGYTLTVSGANFAASPSVTVGGQVCPLSAKSATQLVCTVPAGQGAGLVVAVAQSGNPPVASPTPFSYGKPTVDAATPPSAATGTLIAIDGGNFGLTPTVTIGGQDCPLATSGNTHTHLSCTVPPGGGLAQPLVVTAQGQSSAPFAFDYPPPTVTSISPQTGDTAGVYTLTVAGTNFATDAAVTVGGRPCPLSSKNSTQLACTVSAGQGANLNVTVTQSGNQSASSPVKFSYNPPAVSAVTPPTAGAGAVIAIDGTNFGLTPAVSIGGRSCELASSGNTHTHLSCTVPAGGGLAQPLVVAVQGQSSPSFAFNYPPPTVTAISPQTGDTAGGYPLTVAGTNFATDAVVTVGGRACPLSANDSTPSQLVCAMPVGQGANLDVVVAQSGNPPATSPVKFSYDPPTVSAVTPPVAGAGTIITIDGTNFGLTPTVTVGGQNCPLATSGNTHIRLSCTVPAGGGLAPVVVAVQGQPSAAFPFNYPPPTITSINPQTGDTAGGYTLTVTGTNFAAASFVTVAGNTCVANGPTTSTQIPCSVPPGEGEGRQVMVFSGSQFATSPVKFSYNPPTISAVTPPVAAAGTAITIDGTNFGLTPTVTIGNQTCPLAATGNTHIRLRCTVPVGGGPAPVVVTVQGRSSAPFAFSYPPPTVSAISPQTGDTAGGYTLTVTGTNFAADAAVQVGGQICPAANGSTPTQRVCTVPVGQGANLDVVVAQSGNPPATGPAKFSYNPPAVSAVTPPVAGPGTAIAIDGTNFGLTPTVTIGNQTCPLAATGNTHIRLSCTVPVPSVGGSTPLVVAVQGQFSAPFNFNYPPAELRIEAAASSGQPAVGLPFFYTLTVSNSGGPTAGLAQIIDTVPAGAKLVGVSAPAGWSCAPTLTPAQPLQGGGGATLTCNFANTLAAGQQTLTLTAVPTAATGSFANVATITGDGQTPNTASCDGSAAANCGQAGITPANPRLELAEKLALPPADETGAPDGRAQADEKLAHTFTLANRGDVALSGLALADGQLDGGSLACAAATALGKPFSLAAPGNTLAVNDTVVCAGQHTVTAGEAAAGRVEDNATATAKAPDGTRWQSSASAVWDNAPPAGQIGLFGTARHNDADGDGRFDQGETVSHSFIVRNLGSLALNSLAASDSDPLFPPIACPPTVLAVGAQAVCAATDTVLSLADEAAGQVANTVTATALDAGGHSVAAADATVLNSGQAAALELKQAVALAIDLGAPGLSAGDTLAYTLVATNTGGLALANVTITGGKLGAALQAGCSPAQNSTLNPGSAMVCTAAYTVQAGENDPIDNTALATGKPVGRLALVDAYSHQAVPYAQDSGPSLYSIGNRVWLDNGDGVMDAAETGMDGVVVRLQMGAGTAWSQAKYADNSLIPDQITAGGGYYQFANVPRNGAGQSYRVALSPLNFKIDGSGTKPLYGAVSSRVSDTSAFPWTDGRNQGGTLNATDGVLSRSFDLGALSAGVTVFNSVDFGFVKANAIPPDLAITNTASTAAVGQGGSLSYTLKAGNAAGSGSLTKAPILLDTLPAGMTVAAGWPTVQPANWSCTVSANRQTVSCVFNKAALPLAGGADLGGAVVIPVVVGATAATGAVTNTATITNLADEPGFANNAAAAAVNITP